MDAPGEAPLRVLYAHGLESGPNGYKVVQLRAQGLDVVAPSLKMSLWDPRQSNGLLRSLLSPSALLQRWPWHWLPGAMDDCLGACVAVMRSAVADCPDGVLVGSSWGGAVAAALVAGGSWSGPAVLLCPALRVKERWAGASLHPSLTSETVTAALAALPAERKARMLLVHGTADDVVPIDDSRELSSSTGIGLELIEGGSHGLGSIARDGRLAGFVRRVSGR